MPPAPAPPLSPAALMAREGRVEPLLECLLPHAMAGDAVVVRGPEGRLWRTASSWVEGRLQIVAVDVTDSETGLEALHVAAAVRGASGVDGVLAAAGGDLKLVGEAWARDAQGPLRLHDEERRGADRALAGVSWVSDAGWAAVPVSVDDEVFAALVGPADRPADVARLEAFAVVLAEPLARRMGVGRELEELSHDLRTPLHAILGYVGLLEEELGSEPGRVLDLRRIRDAAQQQLMHVDALLESVRRGAGRVALSVSTFTAGEVIDAVLVEVRSTLEALDASVAVSARPPIELETDQERLQSALFAMVQGQCAGGASLDLSCRVDGVHATFRLSGGRALGGGLRSRVEALGAALGGHLESDAHGSSLRVPRYGP